MGINRVTGRRWARARALEPPDLARRARLGRGHLPLRWRRAGAAVPRGRRGPALRESHWPALRARATRAPLHRHGHAPRARWRTHPTGRAESAGSGRPAAGRTIPAWARREAIGRRTLPWGEPVGRRALSWGEPVGRWALPRWEAVGRWALSWREAVGRTLARREAAVRRRGVPIGRWRPAGGVGLHWAGCAILGRRTLLGREGAAIRARTRSRPAWAGAGTRAGCAGGGAGVAQGDGGGAGVGACGGRGVLLGGLDDLVAIDRIRK